jgi:hypothetical protein
MEAVLQYFTVISRHWPGGTENNDESLLGQPMSRLRLEINTFRILICNFQLGYEYPILLLKSL